MAERTIIPKGKYKARASGGEFAVASTGTEFVFVGFEITSEGDWKGHAIGWKGFFTEATTERTIESLRYAGCTFPGNDITNLEGLGSREVQLVIDHEQNDKGEWWPRVQWVNRVGVQVKDEQRMSAGAKASFKQRMKAALIAGGASASAGGAPERGQNDPPAWTEEPPF